MHDMPEGENLRLSITYQDKPEIKPEDHGFLIEILMNVLSETDISPNGSYIQVTKDDSIDYEIIISFARD